jgi:hypothetical protein
LFLCQLFINILPVTFEQVLVKYLYTKKQVTLQGIGTITLNAEVPDTELINKGRPFAIENLSLEYNPKAEVDDGLIEFYGNERGKIKSLAQSDIESTLQLARQMLNIGKAYEIEGLGSLEKHSNGTLTLRPGFFAVPYADQAAKSGKLKERDEAPQDWQQPKARASRLSPATKRSLVAAALGLPGLAVLWLVWIKLQSEPTQPSSANSTVVLDSATLVATQDSTTPRPNGSGTDSAAVGSLAVPTDTNTVYTWKAYIRSFKNSAAALKSYGFHSKTATPASMDSSEAPNSYRLYVMLNSRVADTTHKLDSMRRWYAAKVVLERQ